ncbi:MAG: hypothetical protein HZA52_03105 [Planctomycetes bacterium]|nr:hypothetical protein [Planctomycetota bacterium]
MSFTSPAFAPSRRDRMTPRSLVLAAAVTLAASIPFRFADAQSAIGAPDRSLGGPFVFVNGPYVTGLGDGFKGADTSARELGFANFGYDTDAALGQRIADDFTVPTSKHWRLSELHWLAYELNPSTTSTITGIDVALWDSSPLAGGLPIWTGSVYVTSAWSNAFRVDPLVLLDNTRAIIDVEADLSGAPLLDGGTYWVDVSLTGAAILSGPFSNPTVPHAPTDNALQYMSPAGWSPVIDFLSMQPQDFPYTLEGTEFDCPLPAVYCTAKVSSHGCVPAIGMSGPPSASAIGGCTLSASQAEGKRVGLFFHSTKGGQGVPFHGGYLCLKPPVKRHAPTNSGGTAGTCTGLYSEDFNAYIASGADPALVAGATVWLQMWGRDPFASYGDSLSDAIEAMICP